MKWIYFCQRKHLYFSVHYPQLHKSAAANRWLLIDIHRPPWPGDFPPNSAELISRITSDSGRSNLWRHRRRRRRRTKGHVTGSALLRLTAARNSRIRWDPGIGIGIGIGILAAQKIERCHPAAVAGSYDRTIRSGSRAGDPSLMEARQTIDCCLNSVKLLIFTKGSWKY